MRLMQTSCFKPYVSSSLETRLCQVTFTFLKWKRTIQELYTMHIHCIWHTTLFWSLANFSGCPQKVLNKIMVNLLVSVHQNKFRRNWSLELRLLIWWQRHSSSASPHCTGIRSYMWWSLNVLCDMWYLFKHIDRHHVTMSSCHPHPSACHTMWRIWSLVYHIQSISHLLISS